jgi:hypothetical protein
MWLLHLNPGPSEELSVLLPAEPSCQPMHSVSKSPVCLLSHQGAPLPLAPSPVLLLPEVGHEDEGTYSCVATHPSHGPQESPPVSIRVTGNPSPNPRVGDGGLR